MAVLGRIERQNFNITFGIGLGGVAEKSPQPQALFVSGKLRKKALRTENFLQEKLLVFVLFWEKLSDKVWFFRWKIELENASRRKF